MRTRSGERRGIAAAWLLLVVLVAAACGGDDDARPLIVVTTTVLADVAAGVAGDEAIVESILPIGADPHVAQPPSGTTELLGRADLVVAVGLGLEDGLADELAEAEALGTTVLRVGQLTEPDWIGESLVLDPHIWTDPLRMALVSELIAGAMVDIGLKGSWSENAGALRATYEALDAEIETTLAAIPAERRLLVTQHESLGYFAGRYGFEVVGAAIEGGSSVGNLSAEGLTGLSRRIAERGVVALFGEVGVPSSLLDAIAADPDLDVIVVSLHVRSLGEPGSGAATYVEMMRTNARLITEALTR